MKLNVYIKDPEAFLKGDYFNCLGISDYPRDKAEKHFSWAYVGEAEIKLEVGTQEVRQQALAVVNKEIQTVKDTYGTHMEALKIRKQNLLALEHNPE